MGIHFNGTVTINGNVEMFDNGSMKITSNQVNINVNDLSQFIEENLKYSPNKEEYLKAAEILKTSNDKSEIKSAITKLKNVANELSKNIFFSGLSQVAVEAIKEMLK